MLFVTLNSKSVVFLANIAAQASKQRMSCRSSSFGRRYLNSRYSSVSELEMVVPERNVAPKSFPVRSCMVRMAKSILRAFWLPSEFPSPATRSWRVLKVRFLNWWLSSIKMWSIPICRKSTTSSVRERMSCSIFSNFAVRLNLRFSNPFSIPREMSFPCRRITSRFSSTVSSSSCKMRCCNSGDCGILPNWSCDMMTQS